MVLPSGVTVRRTTNTIFPSRLLVCSTVFRSISFTATIVRAGSSSIREYLPSNLASSFSPNGVSALNPSAVHRYEMIVLFFRSTFLENLP